MTTHNRDILEAIKTVKFELRLEREANGVNDMDKLLRLHNLYSFLNVEDLLTEAKDSDKV